MEEVAAVSWENWDRAKKAAWRAFGTRYWKVIVAAQLAGKVLPPLMAALGVAALVWAGWWLVDRARAVDVSAPDWSIPGWAWWTAAVLGVLAVVAAGAVVVLRDPYRLPWRYRRGQIARRAAGVLAAVGAATVAVVVWRA